MEDIKKVLELLSNKTGEYSYLHEYFRLITKNITDKESLEFFRKCFCFSHIDQQDIDSKNKLTQNDLKLIKSIVDEIYDPLIRAIMLDLLWIYEKDYGSSKKAIKSYSDVSRILFYKSKYVPCYNYLERAYEIAFSLRDGGLEQQEELLNYIDDLILNYDTESEVFLPCSLISLVKDNIENSKRITYLSELDKYINLAKEGILKCSINSLFEIKLDIIHSMKDKSLEGKAWLDFAEYYKYKANEVSDASEKEYLILDAIECYRKVGGEYVSEIENLHKKLLEIQPQTIDNMKKISASIKLSEQHKYIIGEQCLNILFQKNFKEAIYEFFALPCLINIAEKIKDAESLDSKFIFHHIIGSTMYKNKKGKNISNGRDKNENSLTNSTLDMINLNIGISVVTDILPTLQVLKNKCNYDESQVKSLLEGSSIVREEHSSFFIEAWKYGMNQRWDMVAIILPIQFEDCLRYILEKKGVIVSTLTSEQIQQEYTMTKIFEKYTNELSQIFGEDDVKILKILLINENGRDANLRNISGHGINSAKDYLNDPNVVYCFWFIMKLIFEYKD